MTYSVDKELVVVPVENYLEGTHQNKTIQYENDEISNNNITEQNTIDVSNKYQPSAEEHKILNVLAFDGIESFIKGTDFVKDYGKYSTIPSAGEFYVFVYNREGDISAYLKHFSEGYINIKTGNKDLLTNYKGCGAFWFRFK